MDEGDALVDNPRMMCHVLIMPFSEGWFFGYSFHGYEEGHDERRARGFVAQMHNKQEVGYKAREEGEEVACCGLKTYDESLQRFR